MPNKPKKLSKIDKNILTAVKVLKEPTKANIARHVVSLGATDHIQTVYRRLKQLDIKTLPLEKVENFHREQLVRETYPLAVKRTLKALKNKELDDKDVFPYVKLTYDKVHGDTHRHVGSPSINIESIQNAQIIIEDDLKASKDDV